MIALTLAHVLTLSILGVSLFCVGMALVTAVAMWRRRPPWFWSVLLIGTSIHVLLIAELVYKSPVDVEYNWRSMAYLLGLVVKSVALFAATLYLRAHPRLPPDGSASA